MLEDKVNREKFIKAMELDAEKRRQELSEEIAQMNEKEISKTKKEIAEQEKVAIQEIRSKAYKKANIHIVKEENDARKRLFSKRLNIIQETLNIAAKEIEKFTQTSDYADYLLKKINGASEQFQVEEGILKARKGDMPIIESIKSSFKANLELQEDETIQFGGFILISLKNQIKVDASLDTKLKYEEDGLRENINIKISL